MALKLLHQMQGEGLRPSSACWTSAINACLQGDRAPRKCRTQAGTAGLWRKWWMCQPNDCMIGVHSSACVALVQVNHRQTNRYSRQLVFVRVTAACTAGGQAARAEQLFDRMCSVCKPDAATFNCLVCVYCRLGKVREAANMVEIMLRSGQHVEATTFDAAIDACWATGVVPLQQVGLQLYERANQQGLYQAQVVKQVGGREAAVGCVQRSVVCSTRRWHAVMVPAPLHFERRRRGGGRDAQWF